MSKHYQTFGSGEQANYFVKSNFFPQQTGILGLLRYELLLQNGLLSVGKSKKLSPDAKDLIGPKSFHINGNNSLIDFGAIEALSTLFIMDENKQKILPAPFDICPTPQYQTYKIKTLNKSRSNLKFETGYKEAVSLNYINKHNEPDSYSEKDGIQHKFLNDEKELFNYDDFFIEVQKIGIHKAGDDKSFYKQTKLQLKKGYAFACYATLNVPADKQFNSNTIFMGGDKSAFEMEVTDIDVFKKPVYNASVFDNSGDFNKLILTSPAYVDKSIYDNCMFAITEQQSFRFLQTTVDETDSYYNMSSDKSKKSAPYKSEQFNLLKAGSVFYYNDEQLLDLEKELNKYSQFKQIGYNYYQTNKN